MIILFLWRQMQLKLHSKLTSLIWHPSWDYQLQRPLLKLCSCRQMLHLWGIDQEVVDRISAMKGHHFLNLNTFFTQPQKIHVFFFFYHKYGTLRIHPNFILTMVTIDILIIIKVMILESSKFVSLNITLCSFKVGLNL